ncbi:MAG: hypothetical protein ACLPX7_04230 [Xanthobacteraceae bacterium]
MDYIKDFIAGISTIFTLVAGTSSTAILSVVGILLLILTAGLAAQAIKSTPQNTPNVLRIALFISLVGGMLFSAAGPGLALFWVSQSQIPRVSRQTAFTNLQNNEEVRWLVRLVAYDEQTDPQLAADRLQNLGPAKQLFSFVSAYEDLRGYSVQESVQMTGGKFRDGQHISAVIFPLRTQLYPANARGLLQAIQQVEARKDIAIDRPFLRGQNLLSKEELKDLEDDRIPSYRVENFLNKYQHYCELAQKFRCDEKESFSTRIYIGGLYPDWHPLGFSQRNPSKDPCKPQPDPNYCVFADWNAAKATLIPQFGSRAFVVRNLQVERIPGRMLIDFEQPAHQLIPDIGLRADALK